jgi:hypothetical protein
MISKYTWDALLLIYIAGLALYVEHYGWPRRDGSFVVLIYLPWLVMRLLRDADQS